MRHLPCTERAELPYPPRHEETTKDSLDHAPFCVVALLPNCVLFIKPKRKMHKFPFGSLFLKAPMPYKN
jgi:hypothetical protein